MKKKTVNEKKEVVKGLFVLWIALAALGCAAVNLHISLNMLGRKTWSKTQRLCSRGKCFEKLIGFGVRSCFPDFPTDGGHEDGHQGTEEVEETVGEIGEGGDTQDGGLCQAAGVPWNEYGGDGGGILAGAAEQPQFITLFLIGFLVHACTCRR